MLFVSAISLTLVNVAFALTVSYGDNRFLSANQKRFGCDKGVRIFASRGHSFDNTTTYDSLGGLASLLDDVKASVRPATSRRVHYPNTSPDIPYGVGNGVAILSSMIRDYVAECPEAKIILLGYSEGAMVTMNTLCGTTSNNYDYTDPLPEEYAKNIIATVVYGDLTRAADQPYDMGTCETPGTRARTEPDLCAPFADKIQSYCDYGDKWCCQGPSDDNVHGKYPRRYDTEALSFITSMWATYKAERKPHRATV